MSGAQYCSGPAIGWPWSIKKDEFQREERPQKMAAVVDNTFLIEAATYLGATAVCVPLFNHLKLGTIIGFLVAGVLLGQHGLGLLHAEEGVFHVAELGVVLFLFIIGLELSFKRLWQMRQQIFGLGAAQMGLTGLVIAAGLSYTNILPMGPAMIAGFALACSSTAFALAMLTEKKELEMPHGRRSFSILLFQDLAVIPLLAAIPLVAAGEAVGTEGAFSVQKFALVIGVIIAVILIARFVLDPVFRLVAQSKSREAFAATALFVVAATALAVSSVGLSMALGAFLAGVLLAESSYRHQIESDINPFRELLLGLFFIGVGMQLDLPLIASKWWIVILGALGLAMIKAIIIYLLAKVLKSTHPVALRTALTLSQGGEFAFVVFSLGVAQGIFSDDFASLISAIVTLSMALTPILLLISDRVSKEKVSMHNVDHLEKMKGRALVVGYGRVGQIVSQLLIGAGVDVTAIDHDPKRIRAAARFGAKVYYGDGSNTGLLLSAGAGDADVIIFAMDDRDAVHKGAAAIRAVNNSVKIYLRAFDRLHEIGLLDLQIDGIVRETFDGSMALAGKALSGIGFSDYDIADLQAEFRRRDKDRLIMQKTDGPEAGRETMQKLLRSAKLADETKDDQAAATLAAE